MKEQTKLTLRIDKALIDFAKHYSAAHDKSVSKMVSEYFALLAEQTISSQHRVTSTETPITQSLVGILCKHNISEKDYKKYIQDKYL